MTQHCVTTHAHVCVVYGIIKLHIQLHVLALLPLSTQCSLNKLQDICYPDVDDQRWFSSLEATHWLDYIKVSSCLCTSTVTGRKLLV